MCGLVGAVGLGLGEPAGAALLDGIAHRGPDGRGLHAEPARDALLGHTRLSIVDLSAAGAQPMANEDGTVWLVLNGEIYNHAALRAELEAKGHRFRGRCDAEVVLHLWEEHGEALLERLVGMFAFALLDARDGSVLLARDRLGIKPLFYALDERAPGAPRLAFASELGALLAVPGLDLQPDPLALLDFLTYQFVPAPRTAWRGASKLPAGHLLRLREGRAGVRRWWRPEFEPEAGMDEARALEELDALLRQVVRDHLVSDVPIGLFLSGGVDSSLVAAYLAQVAPDPERHAFSVGFRDRADDEVELAAASAARFGFRHHVRAFGEEDLLAAGARMHELFHEPFADQAAMPMLPLCSLAAEHVKVVLSGDGGDETHLGYGRYFKERERRAAYALADALGGAWVARSPLGRLSVVRNAAEGPFGRLCHFYGGIPRGTKRALIEPTDGAGLADHDDYWFFREHQRGELDPVARLQALDFAGWLPEGILTKVDRTSMRHGLEVRPPLLDHRFVDFAGRLPAELKARGGTRKHLLKRLLERHLPRAVVQRRKRGFSVPMRHFVHERGLFRLDGDLDVLGAFRIRKDRAEALLSTDKDSHSWWLLWVLQDFLRHVDRPVGAR